MNTVLEHFIVRKDHEYATFVVLQRCESGKDSGYFMLAIESSYGHGFAYAWSHPGNDFYDFLCRCDEYYLTSKFAPGSRSYDGEATTCEIRQRILRKRREDGWTAEQARGHWPATTLESEFDMHQWYFMQNQKIDMSDDVVKYKRGERARDFAALYKHLWPGFCDQLREAKRQREETRAHLHALQDRVQTEVDAALAASNIKLG